MIENTANSSVCLNIHLLSCSLPENLMSSRNDVRVTVFTFPEMKKQDHVIKAKNLQFPDLECPITITSQTQKIHIFFQKKNIINKGAIIAWTTIETADIPNLLLNSQNDDFDLSISPELQSLNIYKPTSAKMNEKEFVLNPEFFGNSSYTIEDVSGQIEVQLTVTDPFLTDESDLSKNNMKRDNKKRHLNNNSNKKIKICDKKKYCKSESFKLKKQKSAAKFHGKFKATSEYIFFND